MLLTHPFLIPDHLSVSELWQAGFMLCEDPVYMDWDEIIDWEIYDELGDADKFYLQMLEHLRNHYGQYYSFIKVVDIRMAPTDSAMRNKCLALVIDYGN